MCWLSIDLPAGLNECLTCSMALKEAKVSDEKSQESDRGWAVLMTLKVFFFNVFKRLVYPPREPLVSQTQRLWGRELLC